MKEQKPIILIVDDTPANLGLLFDYLEEEHFRLLVAESGLSALEQIERLKPDIILLDVLMPGMDGFETCRVLKLNPETRHIPIIFLTALKEAVDKVRGFEVGGVDYITKPFERAEVLARIETHLTLVKLQSQLERQNELLEQRVAERTGELSQAKRRLEREIEQRKRHEQEKDKLLAILRQQSDDLHSLIMRQIHAQQAQQQALAQTLSGQVEQELSLLGFKLNLVRKWLIGLNNRDETFLSYLNEGLEMLEQTKNYLHDMAVELLKAADEEQVPENPLLLLSPREQEVLQLLADGKSTHEIGLLLSVSESSIRTYRSRIMKKLEIDNLAGLVKLAIKYDLTPLE